MVKKVPIAKEGGAKRGDVTNTCYNGECVASHCCTHSLLRVTVAGDWSDRWTYVINILFLIITKRTKTVYNRC